MLLLAGVELSLARDVVLSLAREKVLSLAREKVLSLAGEDVLSLSKEQSLTRVAGTIDWVVLIRPGLSSGPVVDESISRRGGDH